MVALAVTVTVLVMRTDSDAPTPADGGDSEFASAGDTGPVNIVTEDPTCDAWGRISRDYSSRTQAVGWGDRDQSVPESEWTPQQRSMYESVVDAQEDASAQAENLLKETPHRVVRELIEQFRVYSKAFAEKVPTYVQADDDLAVVTDTIASALSNICSAVNQGSAQSVAPMIPAPDAPTSPLKPGSDRAESRFIAVSSKSCDEWRSRSDKFTEQTQDWRLVSPSLSAREWTPSQRATVDAVIPVMAANAEKMQMLGFSSDNPLFEDFAVLAAQYQRAYIESIPGFTSKDAHLMEAATYLANTIFWACRAVQR
ncbi:hypothetical protein [Mycobacterium sp. 852013-51886_SCH5428379]|uniref:hypothetical protein n=1 Tax=Mycobacterium sp. 852013-51886_SCH5428379 TaxID=1834111 RepID=UPI001E5C02D7|nr:hypothetical protein [Mycobacterium sp. 852013-51886_SCH5428379]